MPLALLTTTNPGEAYWGPVPSPGLTWWEENGQGDLYPTSHPLTQTLGITDHIINTVYANRIVAVDTDSMYTFVSPSLQGILSIVYQVAPTATRTINVQQSSVVLAYFDASVTQANASIYSPSSVLISSLLNEYTTIQNGSYGVATPLLTITHLTGAYSVSYNLGRANVLVGNVSSDNGLLTINQYAETSLIAGVISGVGGGYITTTNIGTMVFGVINNGDPYTGIFTTGDSCMSFGVLRGGPNYIVSNNGSLAFGLTYGDYDIRAHGRGSLAFGYTAPDNIIVSPGTSNAMQIGTGINAESNSVQIGDVNYYGFRISGDGTTTVLTNGIWCNGTHVYVMVGGATRNLSNIP